MQKHLQIATLNEREVRGRWKSFLRRWNDGALSEGWYESGFRARVAERRGVGGVDRMDWGQEEEDDDDDYGPAVPAKVRSLGPTIPDLQDLQYRRELVQDEHDARRADGRFDRKKARQVDKERMEELAPRGDPGSHERRVEKRREASVTKRAVAEARDGVEEMGDGEIMGDDEGIAGFKMKVRERERAKNAREIRREEVLRAREAERETKVAKLREKEEKTVAMLREIARQRFSS